VPRDETVISVYEQQATAFLAEVEREERVMQTLRSPAAVLREVVNR
jgi:hypothetical protein